MKVKELIEELIKYDPEMEVNYDDGEYGPIAVSEVDISDRCTLEGRRIRGNGVLLS